MDIGHHKTGVFVAVGIMLGINYWMAIVRPRRMNCAPGDLCHIDSAASRWNRTLFWISVVIYAGAVLFTCATLWWIRSHS